MIWRMDNEGSLRFNNLYEEVKADRLKNGEAIGELYKTYCDSIMGTTKKEKQAYGCNITAVWEDITDLI